MKPAHLISCLIVVFVLQCCTKHKDVPSEAEKVSLVKSIEKAGDSCITYCLYDANNRIVSASQCKILETFVYMNDSIIYTRTISGTLDYQYVYYLNSEGIATRYKRLGGNGDISFYTFTYDANWYRTSMYQIDDTSNRKTYTISNKNVVAETSQSPIHTGNYSVASIYYTDKTNTLGNKNYGRLFLGSSTENLRKAEQWTTLDGDFSQQFFYTFDNKGRVQKKVTLLNAQDTVDVRSYTYY